MITDFHLEMGILKYSLETYISTFVCNLKFLIHISFLIYLLLTCYSEFEELSGIQQADVGVGVSDVRN